MVMSVGFFRSGCHFLLSLQLIRSRHAAGFFAGFAARSLGRRLSLSRCRARHRLLIARMMLCSLSGLVTHGFLYSVATVIQGDF